MPVENTSPSPPAQPAAPAAPSAPSGQAALPPEAPPARDLPRLFGLLLFALMAGGAFGFPVLAIVWWLLSLPWLALMFAVLTVTAIAGLAALEYIRLRDWRYSLRQMVAVGLVLFLIGNLCVGLGIQQYNEVWAQAQPLRLANWTSLSLEQKKQLAELMVSGAIQPTPAELLAFRARADFSERAVVRQGRTVREFACIVGPWKVLGQECLIVRIDTESEIPRYFIERVSASDWTP